MKFAAWQIRKNQNFCSLEGVFRSDTLPTLPCRRQHQQLCQYSASKLLISYPKSDIQYWKLLNLISIKQEIPVLSIFETLYPKSIANGQNMLRSVYLLLLQGGNTQDWCLHVWVCLSQWGDVLVLCSILLPHGRSAFRGVNGRLLLCNHRSNHFGPGRWTGNRGRWSGISICTESRWVSDSCVDFFRILYHMGHVRSQFLRFEFRILHSHCYFYNYAADESKLQAYWDLLGGPWKFASIVTWTCACCSWFIFL